ncbi:MAG: restriction endonuclease subunit S [Propionicimonas sp.]
MKVLTLGELAVIVTGRTPSPANPEAWGDYLDFVTPSDQGSESRSASPVRRLSEAGAALTRRVIVPAGSTQLTCIGSTIGKATQATSACVTNQQINSLVARDGVANSGFLYYMVKLWSPELKLMASGSATPIVNKTVLSGVQFRIPPLPTQHAIAEVLGALDDKIAANERVTSSADALVRESFPSLTGDGEERVISDLGDNPRDAARPPFEDGHYVGLEHVPRRSMWLTQTGNVDGLASGKFEFQADDVLFGKLRPYFHKVAVADRRGICSTDILVIRPKRTELKGFVWAALASDGVVRRASAMSEGTRMPRTRWSDLASCSVPWPGGRAAEAFSARVVVLRDRVAAATTESRHLATLRDTLLPHLMSGRLTVRDAEARVEAAL